MTEPNDQDPVPNADLAPSAEPPPPAAAEASSAGATEAASAPPTVGWAAWTPPDPGAAPAPEPPRRMAVRVAEAIAWIVGIAAVLFLGRVFILFNGRSSLSGFQQGEVLGRVVGAVVIGLVVRWAWVKARQRGRVLSPWILLIATASLGAGLASSPGLLPPSAAQGAPIATYLKVGTPYILEPQSASVDARFKAAIDAFDASATEVRQISLEGEAVGFLLVVNIGATESDEFMAGAIDGFEKNPGAEAHTEVIAGKKAMIGTSQDVHAVIWVEEPYSIILYAADAESGKEIAASIIAAYQ